MTVGLLAGKAERCFVICSLQSCEYLSSAEICMDPWPIKPSFWTETFVFLMRASVRDQVS